MKKIVIFIISFMLITLVLSTILFKNEKVTNDFINYEYGIKNNEMLSMMLETGEGTGEYKTTTSSSWPTEGYKFNSELSKCENGGDLSWDDTNKIVVMMGTTSDKCYVYFDVKPKVLLVDYVKSLYTGIQGENGLYFHDSSLTNGANDNSYRYAGVDDNVNNFICLRSDAITCSDSDLFRIIGVFEDKVKIIRAKSIGNKFWNDLFNEWSGSTLEIYLKGEYLNSLGSLAEIIPMNTWKVGGGNTTYLEDVPAIAYQYEVGISASTTTYDAKIGLMYVSDYGFAADPSAWSTKLSTYSSLSKNWLYLNSNEWTISRCSNDMSAAFFVSNSGYIGSNLGSNNYAVRPTFFLLSSVIYDSGDGTFENPIHMSLSS